jgi:16S rRNA (adenine1518-N6/adenine1519-N6)-dimethyltransferase
LPPQRNIRVFPKKRYGQHFLRDENIARKILGYLPDGYNTVLEIGAGTGVLSKYLLQDEKLNPYFFEIDPEAVQYLNTTYPSIKEKIVNADFLSFDLSVFPSPFVIIGNFPYNISSQILFKVLENRNKIPVVIGMFQKEVAERIASSPGTKKYGIISVLLQAYYDIEYLFTVNETVFYPPPKVKSAVLRLKRNSVSQLDCDEGLFTKIVKTAFNQRRKTLRNALKSLTPEGVQGSAYTDLLLSKRAEQLSVNDWVALTRRISERRLND